MDNGPKHPLSEGAPTAEEGSSRPLISCLMPTFNRRPFITHAIEYFLRQTYLARELIIIDDGTDSIADLVPTDPRIRYQRLPRKLTLGAKLNLGCEMAAGEVIAHFDDDDWYAPWRLSYQMEALARDKTELCGINDLLYFDLNRGRAYRYRYPPNQRTWLLGSDLCYTKYFWSRHRFAEINVGVDGLFTWSAEQENISVLPDQKFAVHMIHRHNVSPKQVTGPLWRSHPVEGIESILGADWIYYRCDDDARDARPRPRDGALIAASALEPIPSAPTAAPAPLRNIYACLVREAPECALDLVRNLRFFDEQSRIVLYDGSVNGELLDRRLPWSRCGVEIHPRPRPMKWGAPHGFALDCLHYLKSSDRFDVMTVVDSDQLALRRGYPQYLATQLDDRSGLGLLSNLPERQGPNSHIVPCAAAHREAGLWRPFLRRFADGVEKFVHWSFWPSTVIMSEAGLAILDLFERDAQLAEILAKSRLWATGEVLFPTLAALLGFRVARNPCAASYVKYRSPLGAADVDAALKISGAFWIHPVARRYSDPARTRLRRLHGDWHGASSELRVPSAPHPDQIWPLIERTRAIEGWLADEEAELLALAVRDCVRKTMDPRTIVEIGAYCGKATYILASVARRFNPQTQVIAIDTFDGVVGGRDTGLQQNGPTLETFKRTLGDAGLGERVRIHIGRASEVRDVEAVDFLLLDGLHDLASVTQDFYAMEAALSIGSLVAFHDYASHFPGVCCFVDELLRGAEWTEVAHAGSLKLVQRISKDGMQSQQSIS